MTESLAMSRPIVRTEFYGSLIQSNSDLITFDGVLEMIDGNIGYLIMRMISQPDNDDEEYDIEPLDRVNYSTYLVFKCPEIKTVYILQRLDIGRVIPIMDIVKLVVFPNYLVLDFSADLYQEDCLSIGEPIVMKTVKCLANLDLPKLVITKICQAQFFDWMFYPRDLPHFDFDSHFGEAPPRKKYRNALPADANDLEKAHAFYQDYFVNNRMLSKLQEVYWTMYRSAPMFPFVTFHSDRIDNRQYCWHKSTTTRL